MTACRRETIQQPRLRLVTDNPKGYRPLMPLRELEARLADIDRGLRTAPDARPELLRQRALINAVLATRLTAPHQARRLEQRLRWLTPRLSSAVTPAPGPLARLLHRLHAVLGVATSQSAAPHTPQRLARI